jgi:ATP-dependent Clp protease adapter protein ClpS
VRWYQFHLLHDETTRPEFARQILEQFFYFSPEQAKLVQEEAWEDGRALLGTYSRDVAETKFMEIYEWVGDRAETITFFLSATKPLTSETDSPK